MNKKDTNENYSKLDINNIGYKTKGDASPKGKPRVYISANPADLDIYLESLCKDIFNVIDCAVYFRNNQNLTVEEDELVSFLSQMQLIVVLVTTRYLFEECIDTSYELEFAIDHKIPLLPVVLEQGIMPYYQEKMNGKKQGAGELQFLDKTSNDMTEIPFMEKLRRKLNAVFIDDDIRKQICAAFVAHVFVSYRKKDRIEAQKLMRLIHKIPYCRDFAIWYDEFLVPGDKWYDGILESMKQSDLLSLVVTPSILEKGNYIAKEEYPTAKELEKKIIPIELRSTNWCKLKSNYKGIDKPIKCDDIDSLTTAFQQIAVKECEKTREHEYLIGLAYQNGIDVEVDYERALDLIKDAADKGLSEAMKSMSIIYQNGIGVGCDLDQAIFWQKQYRDYIKQECNDVYDDSILSLIIEEKELAFLQLQNNDIKDARNSCWRAINMCRGTYGRGEFYSEKRKIIFAEVYTLLGDVFKQRKDHKQAYECYERISKFYKSLIEEYPNDYELLIKATQAFMKYLEYDHYYLQFMFVASELEKCLDIAYNETAYFLLGQFYLKSSAYIGDEEAKTNLNKAAKIFEDLIDDNSIPMYVYYLADAIMIMGEKLYLEKRYSESILSYEKAKKILEDCSETSISIYGLKTILNYYISIGNLHKKMESDNDTISKCFSNVLSIVDKICDFGIEEEIIEAKYRLWSSYIEFCNRKDALDLFEDATKYLHKDPVRFEQCYYNISNLFWDRDLLNEEDYVPLWRKNQCITKISQSSWNLRFNDCNFIISLDLFEKDIDVVSVKMTQTALDLLCATYGYSVSVPNVIHISVGSTKERYCRPVTTPDECIYIINDKGEEIRLYRCYG